MTLFVEVLESLATDDQSNGANLSPQGARLDPWTEIVGTVTRVGEVYVAIECVQRFKVPLKAFGPRQIEHLREGAEVGVLFMDDGTTRIREIGEVPRDEPAVVHISSNYQTET